MDKIKKAFIDEMQKSRYRVLQKDCNLTNYWDDMLEIVIKHWFIVHRIRVVFVHKGLMQEDITIILNKLYKEQKKEKKSVIYLIVGSHQEAIQKDELNYYNDEVHSFAHFELFHPLEKKMNMDVQFIYFGSYHVKRIMKIIERIFMVIDEKHM